MTCIIFVDSTPVDIEAAYFKAGYEILPPQLTVNGLTLRALSETPASYFMSRDDAVLTPISDSTAIPVSDGDRFATWPNATFSG